MVIIKRTCLKNFYNNNNFINKFKSLIKKIYISDIKFKKRGF